MPRTDEVVLDVIQLTKVFRDFWNRESVRAVDQLDFQVKSGQVFGLLGPNGSGKTTTVRMILGLLFPTQGAVRLFNRSPRNVEVKKRIGYMPEESHLYGYLNAEETLDFFGRIFRLPRAERHRRRDALIDMVGLRRARKRPIGQYSKGMARRIGLAQALINDPDFLILDEPTTGLDPIGTREMKDLILTLRDRGKTILLCSHLLADVQEICDRICILYGGKRRQEGAVNDLLTAREVTQIKVPHLEGADLERVMASIRETLGDRTPIEVSAPKRRLEEFFLNVVEEARRERIATAGAEHGTVAASFLGAEEASESLIEDLLAAGQSEEGGEEIPDVQPETAMKVDTDEELISDLLGSDEDAGEQAEAGEPAAAIKADEPVRRDVLDELMAAESEEEEADEDKAS